MIRVEVKPQLLRWARERAGDREPALSDRFPKLTLWERGQERPTLKQLEAFAKAAHVSIGYLFLSEPPEEKVPIPDLRTIGGQGIKRPSPDLLDTIYLCQRRQAWYQDYAQSVHDEPLAFVGSAKITDEAQATAARIREHLAFGVDDRRQCPTWSEALRLFIERAEAVGVLVMVSGVVGSNNTRPLDPEEFRGFALADPLAPLVFINGADTKAAQIFTLAHELAHIWLGESALTNVGPQSAPTQRIEAWCNRVAAEILVPLEALRQELAQRDALESVSDLARIFKVSTLVILRRIFDARKISRDQFDQAYAPELARLAQRPRSSGGDYYLTQPYRLSRRFARAVIANTLEGHTLFRDAFRMLGVSKERTFRELARSLEVLP
jgi:Zn-dependent peptidase ImmA (M78 family)